MPPDKAAAIYLAAVTAGARELAPWQWRGIRDSIDGIYRGATLAHHLTIDVNNDGSPESLIEFVFPPPVSAPYSYILGSDGWLSADFRASNGRPAGINGTLIRLDGKTYLVTVWGTATHKDGHPSEQTMDVYRPSKSPMQAAGGLAEHGAGALCEFRIRNQRS